jgi:hypothetical protein
MYSSTRAGVVGSVSISSNERLGRGATRGHAGRAGDAAVEAHHEAAHRHVPAGGREGRLVADVDALQAGLGEADVDV